MTSFVAAAWPSTTVTIAHTIIIARRWLNTSRSSQLPERGSKSASSRMIGIALGSCATVLTDCSFSSRDNGAGRHAARADQHETAGIRLDESGDGRRQLQHDGSEGSAAVGGSDDAPA